MNPFAAALPILFGGPASDAATYTPPGGSDLPLRIILEEAQQEQPFGSGKAILASNVVQFMRSDVDPPVAGAALIIVRDGTVYRQLTLTGDPELDVEGITWRIGAEEA